MRAKIGSLFLIFSFTTLLVFGIAKATTAEQAQQPEWDLLSQEETEKLYQSGPEWTGQGKEGWSEATLDDFSDFPVYWPGDKAAKYNLQAILRVKYQPEQGIPVDNPQDSLSFLYGQCTRESDPPAEDEVTEEACFYPVTIHIQPACLVTPEMIATGVKLSEDLETVRGQARMLRFTDGHVRIWTGSVSVYIHPVADPYSVEEIVSQLRGVGVTASLADTDDLPEPDFSNCKP